MARHHQCLLLLLSALLAAPARVAAGVRGSEFSPTVVMTNLGEMGDKCLGMVDRALGFNAKSIKFVPTVHYYGGEDHITSFCIRDESWACQAASPANIARFTSLLSACVKRAADRGVTVSVIAHLDNMKEYTWRNILQYSPTQKYGGYSYVDVVLKPIADALAPAVKKTTKVIFMLQGETGKSVSQYSKQWLDLVPQVRQWVAAGGRAPASNVKVRGGGVWVCGCVCVCVCV